MIAGLNEQRQQVENDIAAAFGRGEEAHMLKRLNGAHTQLLKDIETAEAALAKTIDNL